MNLAFLGRRGSGFVVRRVVKTRSLFDFFEGFVKKDKEAILGGGHWEANTREGKTGAEAVLVLGQNWRQACEK